MIIAGIDAGSTKTRLVLCDERGNVLGEGLGETCNLVVVDRETARRNLDAVFRAAAEAAMLPVPLTIDGVFLGAAGIVTRHDEEVCGEVVRSLDVARCTKVRVANDIELVLAGGLGGLEGIALIAGTGSNCIGRRSDGRKWQAGGREWLVDDRGSGFRLGLEGITAAVRAADGRDPATVLEKKIFQQLQIGDLDDVIRRLHGTGGPKTLIEKREVASLAPLVIEAAEQGDSMALRIVDREVSELAHMVFTVAVKLDWARNQFCWTVAGSIGNAPFMLERLRRIVSQKLPLSLFHSPKLPPEFGAVLFAAELAGLRPDAAFVHQLQSNS